MRALIVVLLALLASSGALAVWDAVREDETFIELIELDGDMYRCVRLRRTI